MPRKMTGVLKNIGRLRGDRVIWLLILFFAMISMAVVYSATSSLAFRKDTTPFSYLLDQAGFYIIGFAVLLVCYRIPLKIYRIMSYAAIAVAAALLIVPIATHNLRSFSLLGIPIHPAEIAKVAVVLYLARIIEASGLDTFREYALKILIPVGAVCALTMMGSMSATLIIGILTLIILICSGVNRKFILWTIPIALGAVAVAFTVSVLSKGKVFSRFETFGERIERHFSGNEEEMTAQELAEYEEKTFQADQAREAVQLGGIFGRARQQHQAGHTAQRLRRLHLRSYCRGVRTDRGNCGHRSIPLVLLQVHEDSPGMHQEILNHSSPGPLHSHHDAGFPAYPGQRWPAACHRTDPADDQSRRHGTHHYELRLRHHPVRQPDHRNQRLKA